MLLGKILEKLFRLIGLDLIVMDQVAFVLDQQTGDGPVGYVRVLLDDLLPLQCLLECAFLRRGAHDDAS